MSFINKSFMLQNDTAKHLYREYAKDQPIIDYHCHIDPREIYEDKRFENITELWLGADHYKWRLVRSNGVPEQEITGNADPKTKFMRFAEALSKSIGNPMYHWTHLELKRYFDYDGILSPETADQVYELCNEKLKDPSMSARGLIERSNVKMIGTTDDPSDSLEWHKKIAEDKSFKTLVLPSFRPDKYIAIDKAGFKDAVSKLAAAAGAEINSAADLMDALDKTAVMLHLGRQYAKRDIVMQIHFNVQRNPNSRMMSAIGADTGFDCMRTEDGAVKLTEFLNALDQTNELPKTILYSLNPHDNEAIDTIIGSFQGALADGTYIPGKIQHGAAWWFSDTKSGMEAHIKSLANLSILGNFIGMLTDSRSFLSYTRHEYFRRILCNIIGEWVENGEYPDDENALGKIISDICYGNAARHFKIP